MHHSANTRHIFPGIKKSIRATRASDGRLFTAFHARENIAERAIKFPEVAREQESVMSVVAAEEQHEAKCVSLAPPARLRARTNKAVACILEALAALTATTEMTWMALTAGFYVRVRGPETSSSKH